MRKLWAVALKELRQVRRDPLSLLTLLGLPAMMLVLYGYALNFDVHNVALAVQDRDRSSASRELISAFVESTYFALVATPESPDQFDRLMETRVAKAILVIPEAYGRRLARGEDSPVQLLLDGADANTATTALGYATAIVSEASADSVRRTLLQAGQGDLPSAIAYRPRVWYNPELNSTRFLIPGLIGMLLMVTAVLSTALSVVREMERGTMEQLRVAPLTTPQLLLGKVLPYLAISFLGLLIILVAARLLFGIEVRGSYLHLFAATLVYLAGALGFGLLISTVANSQALAFQLGLIGSLLPSMLLSGFIFQIRVMPAPMQLLTYAVPARYYLVILRGIISKGAGLESYLDQLGALALYALLVLALASVRLAREEG